MHVSIITVLAFLFLLLVVCAALFVYSLGDLLKILQTPYSERNLNVAFRDSIILMITSTLLFLLLAFVVYLFTSR